MTTGQLRQSFPRGFGVNAFGMASVDKEKGVLEKPTSSKDSGYTVRISP